MILLPAAMVLLVAASAAAGTVTGVIRNGTSGKPAAGIDVILIQLQGGMQPVASTKTDASGNYKLDNPAIGQGPMLIRAVYRGVLFHQPLTPGHDTVDVTVYEPTSDAKTVQVGSRLIVLQPNGANLLVGEEYALQNNSKPPVAYFNEKGDFNFEIPEGADLSNVSSWGPSGMPVVQGTINRGKQKYAIAYAFQPGDNGVRLSYQVPYPSNQTKLRFSADYGIDRVMLVAPPSVQVMSDGFSPAGTEQGFNLYTRDMVTAGLPFDVSVSGTAPPPSAQPQGDASAADQGQGADPVNGRDSGPTITAMPERIDTDRWILVAGFAGLFALGLIFVWRQPVALATEAVALAAPTPSAKQLRTARKQAARLASSASAAVPAATAVPLTAAAPPLAPAAAPGAATSVATVEREVELSLDGLKDRLFRLELRRQAGTISEEDYARERNQTEQVLRELVRG
jgi:hypothetical protein